MIASVSSLFSAARLFKRWVFNVMFKNSGLKTLLLPKLLREMRIVFVAAATARS
jgi:hypothetical protein